jgi:hypothetical protein
MPWLIIGTTPKLNSVSCHYDLKNGGGIGRVKEGLRIALPTLNQPFRKIPPKTDFYLAIGNFGRIAWWPDGYLLRQV